MVNEFGFLLPNQGSVKENYRIDKTYRWLTTQRKFLSISGW